MDYRGDWDKIDRQYRGTTVNDLITNVLSQVRRNVAISDSESFRIEYSPMDHAYFITYRGHGKLIPEKELVWAQFPLHILVQILTEFVTEVKRLEGWPWKPVDRSGDKLLEILDKIRRER